MKSIYIVFTTLLLCLLISFSQHGGTAAGDAAEPVAGGVPAGGNDQQNPQDTKPTKSPSKSTPSHTSKSPNGTVESRLSSITDPDTMKRMLYVLLGFTSLVVVFFAFKTLRCHFTFPVFSVI